ncbi:MAG: BrnT family toxin [Terriglobales bacterium]
MEFEWDEKKRALNLATHGIDFQDATGIWGEAVLEVPSRHLLGAEQRFLAIGHLKGMAVTVVFTWRGEVRRIISARRARRDERQEYDKAVGRDA